MSGIAMLPETLVVSPMSIIIGFLLDKFNRYRWAIRSGWVFMTIVAGLLILLGLNTPIVSWILINSIVCIGIGTLITSMNIVVQAAADPPDCGHAVAFYVFLRQFGESLGVAIGGVIFQNQLKQNLYDSEQWHNFAERLSKDATTLGGLIQRLEISTAGRTELVQAYLNALKAAWVAMCAISAIGLALTLLVASYSMDKPLKTEQSFVSERTPAGGSSDRS